MSSFRKRHVQKPVPGTRTSPQTGQVITSSGNPSLDVIVGGGLPVGSICIIEEDTYVTYSKVLAKYFVAEGIVSGQSVLLGSLDDDPHEIMRKLPKPLNDDEVEVEKAVEQESEDAPKNGLRIAWRYNDLPPVNSEQTPTKIGHHYNLMEPMDQNLLDFVDTLLWNGKNCTSLDEGDDNDDDDEELAENLYFTADGNEPTKGDSEHNTTSSSSGSNSSVKEVDLEKESIKTINAILSTANSIQMTNSIPQVDLQQQTSTNTNIDNTKVLASIPIEPKIFNNPKYQRFVKLAHAFAKEEKFNSTALVYRSLCRICITSLGSPLWYDEEFSKNILKFLTMLRGIVRNSVAVCFITMPMNLIAKRDAALVPKIRNLADYAIELESFAGSERETNPAFKEYNGLLHLHKINAVNALNAYIPETSDLAFKLRRKKFVIEKLHLPPELQESGEENKPTLSCSSGAASSTAASMDF